MELLEQAAAALGASAVACDDPSDAARLVALAARIHEYLDAIRPSTPVGLPRIAAAARTTVREAPLGGPGRSHVRLVDE
jgi:hypothetical protein